MTLCRHGYRLTEEGNAYTLIELLAAIVIISCTALCYYVASGSFDPATGLIAAVVAMGSLLGVLGFVYRRVGQRWARARDDWDKTMPWIYRVKSLPADTDIVLIAEGAAIAVGDFGWQAEPIHSDGLTYLQGLSTDWQVVWYAGFGEDQIERAAQKPLSQFSLPYSWVCVGATGPRCPYPVNKPSKNTLGFPTRKIDCWVQGRRVKKE